jgi:hypothetical protein
MPAPPAPLIVGTNDAAYCPQYPVLERAFLILLPLVFTKRTASNLNSFVNVRCPFGMTPSLWRLSSKFISSGKVSQCHFFSIYRHHTCSSFLLLVVQERENYLAKCCFSLFCVQSPQEPLNRRLMGVTPFSNPNAFFISALCPAPHSAIASSERWLESIGSQCSYQDRCDAEPFPLFSSWIFHLLTCTQPINWLCMFLG